MGHVIPQPYNIRHLLPPDIGWPSKSVTDGLAGLSILGHGITVADMSLDAASPGVHWQGFILQLRAAYCISSFPGKR
jgi:hypothetical protein